MNGHFRARGSGVAVADADASASLDDDEKYRPRRRRRPANASLPAFVCGFLFLGGAFLLWQGLSSTFSARRIQELRDRRRRAEQVWKTTRLADGAPDADASPQADSYPHTRRLQETFAQARTSHAPASVDNVLQAWLAQTDYDLVNNVKGGIRWIRPYLLPHLPGDIDDDRNRAIHSKTARDRADKAQFMRVRRKPTEMLWEAEFRALERSGQLPGPVVDYTAREKYRYPKLLEAVPPPDQYPLLKPLQQLMMDWPQDSDYTGIIEETLMHFNYSDASERAMAKQFRDAEVPFKLYDVPEVTQANRKWTDDYVAQHFESNKGLWAGLAADMPLATGTAQESVNNFFAFFVGRNWDVNTMGIPPTRNNDWDFAKWSEHARYADAVRLSEEQPHFYWQAGVDREERYKEKSQWTFISRDLPSFSTPKGSFFVFNPDEQKGIQCRFGERGVVAATHYDGGRNMVAMITGAKRYILSPPRECSKLGIFTSRHSPIYRHSLLNFGHIKHLSDTNNDMSDEERRWLERAGQADSLETVLKAGEVLYIPSHWFHYIVSVQKSAQCNVRSGIDKDGNPAFGSRDTVEKCKEWRTYNR